MQYQSILAMEKRFLVAPVFASRTHSTLEPHSRIQPVNDRGPATA